MSIFGKLLKEIFIKPAWLGFLALLGIIGGIQDIIGFIETILGKDLSHLGDNPMITKLSLFILEFWFPILLIVSLCAIINALFQRARYYLGDRIIANKIILITKDDRHKGDIDEKYAWINIENNEDFDLRECYAWLKTIKIKSENVWVDWKEYINENYSKLTFPEFQDKEVVVHSGALPVRLNVAKTNGSSIFLIFERGDEPINVQFVYPKLYVEIIIGGTDYGTKDEKRKIEDKIFRGFLVFERGIDDPYEMQQATTSTKVETKDGAKVTTTTRVEETIKVGHREWYNLYLELGELPNEEQQETD